MPGAGEGEGPYSAGELAEIRARVEESVRAGAPLSFRFTGNASMAGFMSRLLATLDSRSAKVRALKALLRSTGPYFRHQHSCCSEEDEIDPASDFCDCGYAAAVKRIDAALKEKP